MFQRRYEYDKRLAPIILNPDLFGAVRQPVNGELINWPERGGLEVLIALPECATSSSYWFT